MSRAGATWDGRLWTFNLLVEGSNPSRPTNQIKCLAISSDEKFIIFWENRWENFRSQAKFLPLDSAAYAFGRKDCTSVRVLRSRMVYRKTAYFVTRSNDERARLSCASFRSSNRWSRQALSSAGCVATSCYGRSRMACRICMQTSA